MSNSALSSKARRLPGIASFLVILIGCLTLVGWVVDSATLKSVLPGLRPMVPSGASAFILGGAALWLLSGPAPHRIRAGLGRAFAVLVVLMALTALVERLLGLNAMMDWWPIQVEDDLRMPTSTGVSLVLVGAALLMLNLETRRGARPAELLALTAIMIALLTLLGYSYGVVVLYRINPRMAIHSAFALLLLAGGILSVRPDRGLMAVATSSSAGGFMLRRLILAVIGVPSILGWLNVAGTEAGLYGREFGVALLVAANMVVFMIVIWRNAQLLHVTDVDRQKAQSDLVKSYDELESRVEERTADLTAVNEALTKEIAERQRVETELRRSREELADFFENATVGLHWVGPAGTILRANKAELEMLGYAREEYVGHHLAEFHADPDAIEDILERLKRAETLVDYQASLRAKDGSIRNVLINSNVLWEDDRFIHSRCFTNDVTDRKRAEEEREQLLLREQSLRAMAEEAEIRYHNLVHGLDAIVWEADAATFQFEFVSRRAEAILGYPVDRWLREPDFWLSLIHPDDRDDAMELYRSATATGRDHDFEYRALAADGRTVWLHDKVFVVRGTDGSAQQLRGLMVDITERKRAEEEREQLLSREKTARSDAEEAVEVVRRLQTLTDSALTHLALEDLLGEMLHRIRQLLSADAAAILLVTEDGQYLTGRAAIGLEEEARVRVPMGRGVAGRIAVSSAPMVIDDLSTVEVVSSILRKNAKSLIGVPLMIEERVTGVIHVDTMEFRSFTEDDLKLLQLAADRVAVAIEHSRLYEAEQQARLEAEAANRMKDEFLATVSHELRSPLNSILGWITLLREGNLDSDAATRAMETVERSARAQNRIISDLLDVSRIISGQLRLNVRTLEPAGIVETAIDAVRPAADAKSVRLQVLLDPDAGPIAGDSDRLQQIVWNLVSNAIKFTPKGGSAQVRLERVASHIEITVSDTGEGISPEFLPFIFDRFRQADSSSTRRQGGLGLGLAIVRHLVELHGGTVHAESEGFGSGSTFVVKLPLMITLAGVAAEERTHPAAALDRITLERPPQLIGLRVLVVDDEAGARELISAILAECEADVKTVGSAAEALAVLEDGSDWLPEVLISDIEMTELDGYELMRRVRALPAERGGRIPAVALTAYARVEDRMKALAAGFQMHVPKPVEPAELLTVLASVTGRLAKNTGPLSLS
ncbi:MAG: ATP-binding protein [Acidobacteriota bacterium]